MVKGLFDDWTCGHRATASCSQCHRNLTQRANDLQETVNDALDILRRIPVVLARLKPQLDLAKLSELDRAGVDLLQVHAKRCEEKYLRAILRDHWTKP